MLDTELLQSKINALGISNEVLSKLAGVSEPTLRRHLKGITSDRDLSARLYQILISLANLVRACSPVPVSMRNAEVLKNILIWIENSRMSINVNLDPDLAANVAAITASAGAAALAGVIPPLVKPVEKSESQSVEKTESVVAA